MSTLPYTDDDLRAEAARQLALSIEDPDFVGVGERMEDAIVESTNDGTPETNSWGGLLADDGDWDGPFDDAQRKIHDLIRNAADVSEWAIHLGADGLRPDDERVLTINGGDKPIARIHFAFEPDMPDEMRTALVEGLGEEIARYL